MSRYHSKGKTIFWSIVGFVIIVALAFIITSLIMASVHGQSLVTEWQSWFGIVKDAAGSGTETGGTMVMIKSMAPRLRLVA